MLRWLCVMSLTTVLAGCSGTAAPTDALVVDAPSASVSGWMNQPLDDAGTQACAQLKQAVEAATFMEPGVVSTIAVASATADAPVSDAARRLQGAYEAAVAARGSDREPDAVAGVSAAAVAMREVCRDAGLDTVG